MMEGAKGLGVLNIMVYHSVLRLRFSAQVSGLDGERVGT